MKELIMRFWKEEDGMGTVEVVVIVAVLVAVALVFSGAIKKFVEDLTKTLFDENEIKTGIAQS